MAVRLLTGDCREIMSTMEPNSVDAIVTDPPYGLEFMGKEWDRLASKPRGKTSASAVDEPTIEDRDDTPQHRSAVRQPAYLLRCDACGGNSSGAWNRCQCESPSFRSRSDLAHGMQSWHESWGREAYRVLKPGAFLVAFGGTRTHHRLMCAIEDSGFEIRDTIGFLGILGWTFGSGFPKGRRIDNAIIQEARAWLLTERVPYVEQLSGSIRLRSEREKESTALVPARIRPGGDPALLTETTKADGSCVLTATLLSPSEAASIASNTTLSWSSESVADYAEMSKCITATEAEQTTIQTILSSLPSPSTPDFTTPAEIPKNGWSLPVCRVVARSTDGSVSTSTTLALTALGSVTDNLARRYDGFNVALKPAWEPIVLARKPLIGTVAANVAAHGTGALNIDGCRIEGGMDDTAEPWAAKGAGGKAGANGFAGQFSQGMKDAYRRGDIPLPSGRWPANVVLGHAPECREVGVKRVKGKSGGDGTGRPETGGWSGGWGERPTIIYADPDGYETVTAWECADDCAVALLDAQAGERTTHGGGKAPKTATANVFGTYGSTERDPRFKGDTGGASRFFLNVARDDDCWLCDGPKHSILSATTGSAQCNEHAKNVTSPLRGEVGSDSALVAARPSLPLASVDSNPSNGRPALNVASTLSNTQETTRPTALSDADMRPDELLAQRVSDAGSLCDSCATAIAQSLVQVLTGKSISTLGLDSTPSYKNSILMRSLVSFAEPMANTGTIPTIESLSILFGYVCRVIGESTAGDDGDHSSHLRFRYQSKSSRAERNAGLDGMPEKPLLWSAGTQNPGSFQSEGTHKAARNSHPCVKPLSLMSWLCNLVTPPGGTILDPFLGSGSTGCAAVMLGYDFIGIEQSEEYVTLAQARIAHWASVGANPRGTRRSRAIPRANGKADTALQGSLWHDSENIDTGRRDEPESA